MKLLLINAVAFAFIWSQGHFAKGLLFQRRPRDCTVTNWGRWSKCVRNDLGSFTQTQTRFMARARNGGRPCDPNTQLAKTQSCQRRVTSTTVGQLFRSALSSGQASPTETDAAAYLPLDTSYLSKHPGRTPQVNKDVDRSRMENDLVSEAISESGKFCDVIRSPSGSIIASGNCQTTRRRQRREVDVSAAAQFLRRVRRTTETARDMVILLDKSGSIGNHMQTIKDIGAAVVHALCNNVDIGRDRTRVGVASFDTTYQVHVRFNQFLSSIAKWQLENVIERLNIPASGNTHLATAMRSAAHFLNDISKGARVGNPNVEKLLVLITDGCANGPGALKSVMDKYKADKIGIIAIYIGRMEGGCYEKIMDLHTGRRCFEQFFLESWDFARNNFINTIYEENCVAESWADMLDSCD